MRRILKQNIGPFEHMRKKYYAGLFDGEYPVSYEIMSLDPPLPDPPGVLSDLKHAPNKGKILLPTDPLVKNYLRRHGVEAAKDYFGRPEEQIGIGDVDSFLNFNRRAKGTISDAFYFASRQYEYMQKNWQDIEKEDGLTEEEIVANVEALLHEEGQAERFKSRTTAKEMKTEKEHKNASEQSPQTSEQDSVLVQTEQKESEKPQLDLEGLPTMLHGNSKAIKQMTLWSERLNQVPYNRWTVGAATALDHWIASEILGLSERAWQLVLHRKADSATRGMAKDIITVRHALFPETMMNTDEFQADNTSDREDEEIDETEKSIDDLLASLGVNDKTDKDDFWSKTGGDGGDDGDGDGEPKDNDVPWDKSHSAVFTRLRIELNQWQKKNAQLPFDNWNETDKKEFNIWLQDYIAMITEDVDFEDGVQQVDFNETRKSIFSEPYFPYDNDELMWTAMAEDTEAEMLLKELLASRDKMLAEGALAPEEHAQWKEFEKLSFGEQLLKLRSINALQNITENPRTSVGGMSPEETQAFVADHIEHLREGVEMEELVPDLDGPITAKDLYNLPEDEHRFKYRTTIMEAGDDKDRVHTDKLHKDWGRFMANVANNEEELYELGVLDLDRRETTSTKNTSKNVDVGPVEEVKPSK